MGRSERLFGLVALSLAAACGAEVPPATPPTDRVEDPWTALEMRLDDHELEAACAVSHESTTPARKDWGLAACVWLGRRKARAGDGPGAEAVIGWACSQGHAAACVELGRLGGDEHLLPADRRAGALAFVCNLGSVTGCENAMTLAGTDPSLEGRKRFVTLAKTACEKAGDGASCARLGAIYDTAAVETTRVLARRDPAGAVEAYGKACSALVDRYPWDPPEPHANPKLAADAKAAEGEACEKVGDHYFSGDGVPVDPLAAVDAYRSCPTDGCRAKRAALLAIPRVKDYDAERTRVEGEARAKAEEEHAELVAEEEKEKAEAAKAQAEAESARREEAAEQNRAAWGAALTAVGAGLQQSAAAMQANGGNTHVAFHAGEANAHLAELRAHVATHTAASIHVATPHPVIHRVVALETPGPTPRAAPRAVEPSSKAFVTIKATNDPPAGSPADAQRAAALAACMAVEPSCGTGGCLPAGAYADRFSGRRSLVQARAAAATCTEGASGWAGKCMDPKVAPLLKAANLTSMADKMDDVGRRTFALSPEATGGMPSCTFNPEVVRGATPACAPGQAACIDALDQAMKALDCAHGVDQFLFLAEPKARLYEARRLRDVECHLNFGY